MKVTMQIPIPREFAAFVRRNRVSRGLTQEQLADMVHKSRRWVHDLEAGKVDPSLGATIATAEALGFTLSLDRSEGSAVLDALFEDLDG